jgi:hypothetical protein
LTCSTDSARELLDETVDGLQRAMESRGIVVERLEVVHDATMDGFGDAGAGARQDEHAAGERGAGGTGQHERGMREMGQSAPSDDVELIAHDPAFTWNGSRMALSTLA